LSIKKRRDFYLSVLLAKNRDKNIPTREVVLRTDRVLAVKTEGADYFGLALNRNGCAFVSAAVNSPLWTRYAEAGDVEKAAAIYNEENLGLRSPSAELSDYFEGIESVNQAVDLLGDRKAEWMGYNILIADRNSAALVETSGTNFAVRTLEDRAAITNHFSMIDGGPRTYEDYPSSYDRLEYAGKLNIAIDADTLSSHLEPGPGELNPLWRSGSFFTVSSSVIDLKTLTLNYFPRHAAARESYFLNSP